jgi:benzil reductase ((S)-benzoin forming)
MKITNKSLSIVTGGTGGLGSAISNFILENKGYVLYVGRNFEKINKYERAIKDEFLSLFYKIKADLGVENDLNSVESKIIHIISSNNNIEEIYLFNNASIIDPISLIKDVNFSQIKNALVLNIASAYTLTSAILRIKQIKPLLKINIINISSGVSINAVKGWSAYCISKAGLNMLSKCVAMENESEDIFSLSINPGAIDTGMQEKIRNADSDVIPATQKFQTMFDDGKLQKPDDVADKLFRILGSNEYSNGDFIDFNYID